MGGYVAAAGDFEESAYPLHHLRVVPSPDDDSTDAVEAPIVEAPIVEAPIVELRVARPAAATDAEPTSTIYAW